MLMIKVIQIQFKDIFSSTRIVMRKINIGIKLYHFQFPYRKVHKFYIYTGIITTITNTSRKQGVNKHVHVQNKWKTFYQYIVLHNDVPNISISIFEANSLQNMRNGAFFVLWPLLLSSPNWKRFSIRLCHRGSQMMHFNLLKAKNQNKMSDLGGLLMNNVDRERDNPIWKTYEFTKAEKKNTIYQHRKKMTDALLYLLECVPCRLRPVSPTHLPWC